MSVGFFLFSDKLGSCELAIEQVGCRSALVLVYT